MQFRPCIDIHNGKVKQIVGSSLKDAGDTAKENFVASMDADYYSKLYQQLGLTGGHIILLNSRDSEYFEATKNQALKALGAYPMGMQLGGGVNPDTAREFLEAGASHVIVTSYVFKDGIINFDNLERMANAVTPKRLVLDLSCRRVSDDYIVVTDRWQKFTSEKVDIKLLEKLADYCDEFLIHAVDVEGKSSGIEHDLVKMLSEYDGRAVTYAGGIGNYKSLLELKTVGNGRIHATIGSGLDIFGGPLEMKKIIEIVNE